MRRLSWIIWLLVALAPLALARPFHGTGSTPSPDASRHLVGTQNDLWNTLRPSDGLINTLNFHRYSYAYQANINPSAIYAGFTTTGGAPESNLPNKIQCETALELPDTTITRFTTGGNNFLTISPGDIFDQTDQIAATQPLGGAWLRGYCTVGVRAGTISGGSGYTPGSYPNVALTGSATGINELANITVNASGVVTAVAPQGVGQFYKIGDVLTGSLPGGSGFTYTVTGNGFFYFSDYGKNVTFNDCIEIGTNLTDKTTSGTVDCTAVLNMPGPVAMMATTAGGRRSAAILLDSLSVGVGGFVQPLTGGILGVGWGGGKGYVAGYLDGLRDYVHFGRSGESALVFKTNMTKRAQFAALAQLTDDINEGGINDLAASNQTALQVQSSQQTIIANFKSFAPNIANYCALTTTPEVTITGSPPTSDSNQTVIANLADGKRDTYNALVVAGSIAGTTAHANVVLTAQNALNVDWWIANYSNDGVHPLQVGGAAMVNYLQSLVACP